MNLPSISIIVPVYNVESYVEACLLSVMHQTYQGEMECIVVDDCGTDQSMAVVEDLISKDNGPISFKVLRHEKNRGLSAARNTGMDAARGVYFFFLDSDDELVDDCIEKMANPLKTERYDIIVGNTRKIDELNNVVYPEVFLKIPDNKLLRGYKILQALVMRDWMIAVWNKLYLADFIRRHQLRFTEGIIFEDVLWSFKAACVSSSLFSVNQITYIYKKRDSSIINSSSVEKRINSYSVNVIEMKKFVNDIGIYNESVHEYIQDFFHEALCLCSFRQFVDNYRKMRPNIEPSLKQLKNVDRKYKLKRLRDFHYYIPINIAPYWHFFLYSFMVLFLKCLNKMHLRHDSRNRLVWLNN